MILLFFLFIKFLVIRQGWGHLLFGILQVGREGEGKVGRKGMRFKRRDEVFWFLFGVLIYILQ